MHDCFVFFDIDYPTLRTPFKNTLIITNIDSKIKDFFVITNIFIFRTIFNVIILL